MENPPPPQPYLHTGSGSHAAAQDPRRTFQASNPRRSEQIRDGNGNDVNRGHSHSQPSSFPTPSSSTQSAQNQAQPPPYFSDPFVTGGISHPSIRHPAGPPPRPLMPPLPPPPASLHLPTPPKPAPSTGTSVNASEYTSSKEFSSPSRQVEVDNVLVDTDDEEEPPPATTATTTKSIIGSNPPTATNSPAHSPPGDHDHDDFGNESRDLKAGDAMGVHEDVEFIDEVEWASEDTNYGELAARPKPDPMGDPCGCSMEGVLPDDISDFNSITSKPLCCVDPSCILFACQEECRSNCEAGPFCGNKRIQKKEWKKVEVFHAGPKGRGLRMMEDVKKGDFLLEYVGKAVRASYLSKLFQRYRQERRLYIMALDNNVLLDARKKGSVARYINHSCEPNCVVERWKVRGIIRAGIFALRDIAMGEELSFDYQWERKKGRAPTKCYCGTPSCRGTLEVPKSLEEQEFEKSYEGHWKPGSRLAGREIINRSIRISSKEHEQFFYADVCKYDEKTGKHLVIYRQDWEEVWEDLAREDWQILDEGASQEFVIAKKARASFQQQKLVESPEGKLGSGLLAKIGTGDKEDLRSVKPYLYVQTPIKEAFWAKHLIQRCERNCRVTIQAKQMSRPPIAPNPKDPDDVEKHKALDESLDGTVWKLSISGYNVAKACTILERNVLYLTRQQQGLSGGSHLSMTGGKKSGGLLNRTLLGSSGLTSPPSSDQLQEVVMPRCAVDIFKRRLPLIREKCKSVNISFAHSESKTKSFAKLLIEASLQSDMITARECVWTHVNTACIESNALKTPNGNFYEDLGFLGGELTGEQFRLLLNDSGDRKNIGCREDLRQTPFIASFESTQRCSIWVQAEEDKGRIDGMNNIVGEAIPNAPRKIFFGCDPKDVSKLWSLIQTRAAEVARGVKYLYLGADRVYLPKMLHKGHQFFDYVKHITGASVIVDHMTGDHLRIDGRSFLVVQSSEVINLENEYSEQERVALAEEILRLQIEIYRDHCIRQQNWIFGRDWTLSTISTMESLGTDGNQAGIKPPIASTRLQLDEKTVVNACQEIADVTAALGCNGSVGAGAAIIFYRFVTMIGQREDFETQLKMREFVLGCIFLVNKAQKATKWKRLESVLEAGYQVFYPGALFDSKKEEVVILAERVLLAETEILNALNYDVFWRGTEWIVAAAIGACYEENFVADVLDIACSGPVLASGSTLWLKYGMEYVFAAAAGFLDANIENLFVALSLIPLKVLQAAEIIAESVRVGTSSKRGWSHPLFDNGRETLLGRIPRIKDVCAKNMVTNLAGVKKSSESEQRYHLIGSRDCRQLVIPAVPRSSMKKVILPVVDCVCAESKCNIYIQETPGAGGETDDIVFEGSWRAVAIAEHLLRARAGETDTGELPPAVDVTLEPPVRLQAKLRPGLLNMGNVDTSDGWNDTIQSQLSGGSTSAKKTGAKICVSGKISASSLREVGLRWWIPPQHGPSPSGSICDMFIIRSNPDNSLGGLKRLAKSLMGGDSDSYPMLIGSEESVNETSNELERSIAVSLQRWPSEKVESRESEKSKRSMGLGFSAAALQEMQLLTELHSLIPSPQGHPNFILPVALALPSEDEEKEEEKPAKEPEPVASAVADDIFSLFRTSEDNEKVARRQKKRKDLVSGPHVVFQPSPFVLQRFMSKKKRKDNEENAGYCIGPAIFSAWFHDLLSALVHCHANHVIVRSFLSDQVIVDQSGVAKLGGLYRSTTTSPEDRNQAIDLVKIAKALKKDKKKSGDEDIDSASNPYIAPEHLLGCPKHTKESDVWSLGCMLAHVLMNKTVYSGRDRQTLLNNIYKVAGAPARDNFKAAVKLPNYRKPLKKYKRGVEKAIQHVMKEEAEKHAGAIDLLAKMLHLDPSQRITAVEALRHQFMIDYLENSNTEAFRLRFVEEWMDLKSKVIKSSQSHEDEARMRERNLKRKAVLLAASKGSNDDDQDDLYNIDDLFTTDITKKPRI